MTEQERRALFFKVTGQVYSMTSMGIYSSFCKGLEAGYEAGRKDENEACAKVCEDSRDAYDGNGEIASGCAHDIRARREQ